MPRLATPRNLERPTEGDVGAFIGHLHGRSHLPWQRDTFDLIGELDPATGRLVYDTSIVLVPRQCGKTAGIMDDNTGRMMSHRDYRVAYAAQTGHVTTERFAERFTELEGGPLVDRVKLRRSQGTERITWKSTGSYVKAFPPKDGALRSSALDRVIVDEAQEHSEALGYALDTTIIPTFSTRSVRGPIGRQLVLIGTAGTDASQYLWRYLEQAREYTLELLRTGAPGSGIALIEYGAHDGEDTDDEAVWIARHPGLAGGLTDIAELRAARRSLGRAGFAREYMNVWSRTSTTVIPPEKWRAVQTAAAMPAGRVAIAVHVAQDRSSASIAACGPDRFLEHIKTVPVDEAAAEALRIARGQGAGALVCDKSGPSGTVHDELTLALEDAPDEQLLLTPTNQDRANGCADLLDDILNGAAVIRADPHLDAAVEVAALKEGASGTQWDTRGATGNIAPLAAITHAAWGYARMPEPLKKPMAMS